MKDQKPLSLEAVFKRMEYILHTPKTLSDDVPSDRVRLEMIQHIIDDVRSAQPSKGMDEKTYQCSCGIGLTCKVHPLSKGMVEKETHDHELCNCGHKKNQHKDAGLYDGWGLGACEMGVCPCRKFDCVDCFKPAPKEGSSGDKNELADVIKDSAAKALKVMHADFNIPDSWPKHVKWFYLEFYKAMMEAKLSAAPLVPLDKDSLKKFIIDRIDFSYPVDTDFLCSIIVNQFGAHPSRTVSAYDIGEALAKANIEFNGKSPSFQWRNHMGKSIHALLSKEQ